MANLKASKKDIRTSSKRRVQNAHRRARLRTMDKKIRLLVGEGNMEEAGKLFRSYTSFLDRAGKTNLIHHKKADRKKGRMAKFIDSASTAKAS